MRKLERDYDGPGWGWENYQISLSDTPPAYCKHWHAKSKNKLVTHLIVVIVIANPASAVIIASTATFLQVLTRLPTVGPDTAYALRRSSP